MMFLKIALAVGLTITVVAAIILFWFVVFM